MTIERSFSSAAFRAQLFKSFNERTEQEKEARFRVHSRRA